MITTVLSTLGFNFNVLVPVLVRETLDAGPEVFGALSAAFGAGALAGALLSATWGRASYKALLTGTGGFGLVVLVLAPQTSVPVAAALLFVAGVCFILWNSNTQSLLQLTAPDHLRGRVMSLFMFSFAGLGPLGALAAGWLAEHRRDFPRLHRRRRRGHRDGRARLVEEPLPAARAAARPGAARARRRPPPRIGGRAYPVESSIWLSSAGRPATGRSAADLAPGRALRAPPGT